MLNDRSSLPWLCVRDFNEVLHANEQFGGVGRSERQMEGFHKAVSACGFSDLGIICLPYTWDNHQEADHNIKVRLDRGLATDSFLSLFKEVKVWHVQTTTSDHCALVVESLEQSLNRRCRKRSFRYENMWQWDPSYMVLIHDAWPQTGVGGMRDVQNWLQEVQSSLRSWEQNIFGSVRKTLASLRRELEEVRGQSVGTGPSRHDRQLMSHIQGRDYGATATSFGLAKIW